MDSVIQNKYRVNEYVTLDAERGGVVDDGGVVGHAARVLAAVARRQLREHQQRELIQVLLFYLNNGAIVTAPHVYTNSNITPTKRRVPAGWLAAARRPSAT